MQQEAPSQSPPYKNPSWEEPSNQPLLSILHPALYTWQWPSEGQHTWWGGQVALGTRKWIISTNWHKNPAVQTITQRTHFLIIIELKMDPLWKFLPFSRESWGGGLTTINCWDASQSGVLFRVQPQLDLKISGGILRASLTTSHLWGSVSSSVGWWHWTGSFPKTLQVLQCMLPWFALVHSF